MKRDNLLVDGHPYRPAVVPPGINEAVFPFDEDYVNKMKVCKGDIQTKGGCQFIGYASEVQTIGEVCAAYTKVKWMHPGTLHIAFA